MARRANISLQVVLNVKSQEQKRLDDRSAVSAVMETLKRRSKAINKDKDKYIIALEKKEKLISEEEEGEEEKAA